MPAKKNRPKPAFRRPAFWLLVTGVPIYLVYRQWLAPEITIKHRTDLATSWQQKVTFELTNSGAWAATHVVYRCRFFQAYDLERRIKYVPTGKLVWRVRGAITGHKGVSIDCDLFWDTPRPAAVDMEVTVRYYAGGRREQANQRFCLMPGPEGQAVWAPTAHACEFRGNAEVAALQEEIRPTQRDPAR